jgi:hypothetical protein
VLRFLELAVVLGALVSRRPVDKLPAGVDAEDLAEGYEHGDMRPAAVVGGALGLLVIMGIVLVAITSLEAAETGIPPSISRPQDLIDGLHAAIAPTPGAPRLEAQSGQELGPYRAAQEQKLGSYRWVDRNAGVVGIPIDRAMDLVAQQGLPARTTPPAALDTGGSSPSDASSGRVEEAYP